MSSCIVPVTTIEELNPHTNADSLELAVKSGIGMQDYKLCKSCARDLSLDRFTKDKTRNDGLCFYCKECKKVKGRAYYENNLKLCRSRGNYYNKYIRDHDHRRQYIRERLKRIRQECLQFYSKGEPKCACCGERQYEFLCIDHLNNDGAEHRRITNGYNIYQWLKTNNYPSGFQVLCHNCNCAKGFYGACPHELERSFSRGDGLPVKKGACNHA